MTRKRMVKQMMSTGYSRNEANCFAVYIQIRNLKYEDWNEILSEIQSNSDETIKRYNEMSEMNDRAFELARRTQPTPENPCPWASINFRIDLDLIDKRWITIVLLDRRRDAI